VNTKATKDDVVSQTDIPTDTSDVSMEVFATRSADVVDDVIADHLQRLRSMMVQLHVDILMLRDFGDGEPSRVPAYFITSPQLVNWSSPFDLEAAISDINRQVDDFNQRGSGFVVERILKVTLNIMKYRPLVGSSFLPTPERLAKKHCIINVQNQDQHCFAWSVLAALYPDRNGNAHKVSAYRKYFDNGSLNLHGLQFPLKVENVKKFENQNPSISVNVLYYDQDDVTSEFVVAHMSAHRDRPKHVNLLLLDDSDSGKQHYVLISSMSRLVASRTKHKEATHVCNSCLHPFWSEESYQNHLEYCLKHQTQVVNYPDPEDEKECVMKFRAINKQFRLPFYLVCDFEAFLAPNTDSDEVEYARPTHTVDEHNVCGFSCYRVTNVDQYRTDPVVFSGEGVMDKFYDHLMSECKQIGKILGVDAHMNPLTLEQQVEYDAAVVCDACNKPFTDENHKTRHHCHVTGNYLFPACNNCNLQLKTTPKRRRISRPKLDTKDEEKAYKKAEEDYVNEYFLPVVFHNLRSYDGHIVLKHFKRQYTERIKKVGGEAKITFDDVQVTAINSEKYLSFQIGSVRFIDSFQFLSTSLENLVSLLLKSGRDKFAHTVGYLGDHDLVFAKGVYPYSYMTDRSKFAETELPPIDAFYDTLNDEPLDPKDYTRAQQTWHHFGIRSMQQYHDHYLLSDTLLLADVFENFRNDTLNEHCLDPLHFMTLPSLAWTCALKLTDVELDLITEPDMYLMVENSMRGGISTISRRHAKANNPQLKGYDPSKSTSYITYLDCNNLYGTAMSEPLPVGKFRFLDEEEIAHFDLSSIAPDANMGYFIECDLSYPPHLHDLHSDYPLAPEHLTVTEDMLSEYARTVKDAGWRPTKKLTPNLMNKTKYVTHYRNLQFYVKHGLIITRIHRILEFSQRPWLKSWIDYCTVRRQMATSEFESDLAKLSANATFGKSMENVRNRVNVRLICDPKRLTKATNKPTFRQAEIINDDLTMVRAARKSITLKKPISVGFAILELSKLIMYSFYYEYMKPKYGDKCSLLFTDTDSFCCYVETDNLHSDMKQNLDLFDTANFDKGHPLYSNENHRVLGKFKSETGSTIPKEFVGLRAKMYSLKVPKDKKQSKIKVKGVKKSYTKKNVSHEQFLHVLRDQKSTYSRFRTFRSRNHRLQTVEIKKRCLNAFDDKRYIQNDGVRTLAYGHYRLVALH